MEKNLLPKHNSQLSRNHYNTIYDRDLQNKIRIARLHWRTSTLRETLAQPFHCYLHRLDCATHKNCNTLLWNTSLRYTSSHAQRVATHAKHKSTASTKNRKSHLEPSVPLHAQFETDSTAKQRRPATVAQASQLFSATDALFTRKNTMFRANPNIQIASMM